MCARALQLSEFLYESTVGDLFNRQRQIFQKNTKRKRLQVCIGMSQVRSITDKTVAYCLNCAKKRQTLSWLNALPIKRYNFHLIKGKFRDGLAFRYGWETVEIASTCASGDTFVLFNAFGCPK